jgi:hypothetical protein
MANEFFYYGTLKKSEMCYLVGISPVRMCDIDVLGLTRLYTAGNAAVTGTRFLKASLKKRFKYHIWSNSVRHVAPRRAQSSRFFYFHIFYERQPSR